MYESLPISPAMPHRKKGVVILFVVILHACIRIAQKTS